MKALGVGAKNRWASSPCSMNSVEFGNHFHKSIAQTLDDGRGDHVGRREKQMIAAVAIGATLHRIGHHALVEQVLRDAGCDIGIGRERCAGLAIVHEFDGH